mmetsp:Transcript_20844/g.29979  ORF Transcript_20844/g.29979 Transcript_20844/m.29979 type:complete len:400 (-) Transcript_20844:160-1359(-)
MSSKENPTTNRINETKKKYNDDSRPLLDSSEHSLLEMCTSLTSINHTNNHISNTDQPIQSHTDDDVSSQGIDNEERFRYYHLRSKLEPSLEQWCHILLSYKATMWCLIGISLAYISLLIRYAYLRVVNSPTNVVAYLMCHIMAQFFAEILCKFAVVYYDKRVLHYRRMYFNLGSKTAFIFVILFLNCVATILGSVDDNHPSSFSRCVMTIWRGLISVLCLCVANDNTYFSSLYHEHFFLRGEKRVYLHSTIDLERADDPTSAIVIPKSSNDVIIARLQELMPTLTLYYWVLSLKSAFNVLNSAIFFILSVGVIGQSRRTGLFFYNVFMIIIMSVLSYTSFESITGFNKVIDQLGLSLQSLDMNLGLHVRVSSYAVDDRFLALTVGAALLQVVLKTFGVS